MKLTMKDIALFSVLFGTAVCCFTFAALCLGFAPLAATLLSTSIAAAAVCGILIAIWR